MRTVRVSPEQARRQLVSHLGLTARPDASTAKDIVSLVERLRAIQLDPIDRVGTNADLVVHARLGGLRRSQVYEALHPGHAFEHFAKERCLLRPAAFPYYRDALAAAPWWRLTERMKRIDEDTLESVLNEVRKRGPVAGADLEGYGRVKPLDWSGWVGTSRAATMALEILWTRCQVVVAGRTTRGKLFDLPERVFGELATAPLQRPFEEWALLERVEMAGVLAHAGGPCWSMLSKVRTGPVPDALWRNGEIDRLEIEGSRRPYWTAPGFFDRVVDEPDDAMRVLGPLDPLIWDRKLVQHLFGFEYIWEVYKPEAKRRWGYYVCPLLHRGELVGRVEARRRVDCPAEVGPGHLEITRVWRERPFDERAFAQAMGELAAFQ